MIQSFYTETIKISRETKLKTVVVIRDGQEKQISLEAVLVGDILKLRIGDIIYGYDSIRCAGRKSGGTD